MLSLADFAQKRTSGTLFTHCVNQQQYGSSIEILIHVRQELARLIHRLTQTNTNISIEYLVYHCYHLLPPGKLI